MRMARLRPCVGAQALAARAVLVVADLAARVALGEDLVRALGPGGRRATSSPQPPRMNTKRMSSAITTIQTSGKNRNHQWCGPGVLANRMRFMAHLLWMDVRRP